MNVLSVKKIPVLISLLLIASFSLFADSTHKVEKGDTLYSISRKYSVTVAELRAANKLSESDIIKIGQVLVIPGTDNKASSSTSSTTSSTQTYVIQKGDTLYGIARKFDMKINDLLDLNGLTKESVIKVGQKLKVKSSVAVTTTTTSSDKTTSTSTETTVKTETKAPDTRTYGTTVESDTSTVWPVKNPTVTTVKGKASGVTLSAQLNESVKCIREGTVMYVGVYRGFGQVVFVQSKTGAIYVYAGLGTVGVKKGDYKVFGDELGTAGIDSITGKSQITFMVFQNGQPTDPAKAPRN